MILAAISVGIGFIVHELSHKITAQKYHCWAEFRADDKMLILAIIMSFMGFVFAAPGAVMIIGQITHKQNGKISMSGPLANLIVALVFFAIASYASGVIATIASYGFIINSWLALFNMLPFGNFDGAKILMWDKKVYGAMVVVALLMVFFGQMHL
jgi:Zn-dependent protease